MMTLNNFNIRISLWGSLAITFAIWAFTIYYISEFCLIKEFSVFIYSWKWSQVINCHTINCNNNSYAYCVFRLIIWKSTSRWNAAIYIIAKICKTKIRNFTYWQHFCNLERYIWSRFSHPIHYASQFLNLSSFVSCSIIAHLKCYKNRKLKVVLFKKYLPFSQWLYSSLIKTVIIFNYRYLRKM